MNAPPELALCEQDLYLFNEGTHRRLADKMGAHPFRVEKGWATVFAVWAPNAKAVSVVGDFNAWDPRNHPLDPSDSGIWQSTVAGVGPGDLYKFALRDAHGELRFKADPFALRCEEPPASASVVWDLGYEWGDQKWISRREETFSTSAPVSIYEVHLGSWQRPSHGTRQLLGYREIAPLLAEHLEQTGFTHVELLPVMEHPFYGSWGYQTTGYFAPTARYGLPQDFMYLVDYLHQAGFGVIVDWVPSHFATDAFSLGMFDGTHLYEHADARQGIHPDWNSYVFNYERHEVRSMLLSSALHWIRSYHADGLRVDAVASMLYLDYSRADGEWVPNAHGGRENLGAIELMRQLNSAIAEDHPGVCTVAEESTAWPGVCRPPGAGGLGFNFKWDMGWMHDTLQYLSRDPIHRRWHHDELTFRALYMFDENFVLALSHDEVVHGKGSLLSKMPGDQWQRFANLRLLLAYQFTQPGKKLLFMGSEIAQSSEWDHDRSLDWHLLEDDPEGRHRGVLALVSDLNRLYRAMPALHELDCDEAGFTWVLSSNSEESVLGWLRWSTAKRCALVVCNFTPVVRHELVLGVPVGGRWVEVLNTDATVYGGSGVGNLGAAEAWPEPTERFPCSIRITAPPLACVVLEPNPG